VRGFTTLLLACVAACGTSAPTASRPPATAAWLARFADAMEFVPDGMSSWSFHDLRAVPLSTLPESRKCLDVACGRRFQSPRDVGGGAHEGVTIQDYGTDGIPQRARDDVGDARPAIAGAPTWRRAASGDGERPVRYEQWTAFVDGRFVVVATSEALMRQALQRTGAPRFGSLEPLPAIDPAAVALVVRDLGGEPPTTPANMFPLLNLPGVSAIAAVSGSPWRVRTWGRDEAELMALTRFCFQHVFAIERAARDGDYWSSELARRAEDHDEPTDATIGLGLAMFFGHWIFI
jgi:hypothetical protein